MIKGLFIFSFLTCKEQSVGCRVGVAEPFLMRMAHGAPMRTSKSKEKITGLHGKCQNRLGVATNTQLSHEQSLRVCKRFYVALILSRLVQVFCLSISRCFFLVSNNYVIYIIFYFLCVTFIHIICACMYTHLLNVPLYVSIHVSMVCILKVHGIF